MCGPCPRRLDGAHCAYDAQPPFLLRWSPEAIARFCPTHFEHDASTNALRLKAGKPRPWLLSSGEHPRLCTPKGRQPASEKVKTHWHYCSECHTALSKSHSVPFSDEWSARASSTLPKLPDEQYKFPDKLSGDRLEAIRKARAALARPVAGPFGNENLVPNPAPVRWQNAPGVPLHRLDTQAALSQVSMMHVIGDVTPARFEGVGRAAHSTGTLDFRRRGPKQLDMNLLFMVNDNKGNKLFKARERKMIQESLVFLRVHNPLTARFVINFERFRDAYRKVPGASREMTLLPTGVVASRAMSWPAPHRRNEGDNFPATHQGSIFLLCGGNWAT